MFPGHFVLIKKNGGLALCLPYNQGTRTPFVLRRVRPSVLAALSALSLVPRPGRSLFAPHIEDIISLLRSTNKPPSIPSKPQLTSNRVCNDRGYVQLIGIHGMI